MVDLSGRGAAMGADWPEEIGGTGEFHVALRRQRLHRWCDSASRFAFEVVGVLGEAFGPRDAFDRGFVGLIPAVIREVVAARNGHEPVFDLPWEAAAGERFLFVGDFARWVTGSAPVGGELIFWAGRRSSASRG